MTEAAPKLTVPLTKPAAPTPATAAQPLPTTEPLIVTQNLSLF
jgi:hypothetical protein